MAKLVFRSGPYNGKSVTVPPGRTLTMGRNRDLELPLPDLKLSRRHCQIYCADDKFMVKDLGSTNGTFVNGERIEGEVELNDFDRVVLGDTEIEFHLAAKMPLPHNFDPNAADPVFDDIKFEDAGGSSPAPPTVPAAAPPPARIGAPAITASDPMEAALLELALPLPPEPPPLQLADEAAPKSQVMFCDVCSGSIPMLDWDLGIAREVNGKMFCKDCAGKAPSPAPAAPVQAARPPPPVYVGTPAARKEKTKSISDILSALDDEAVIVDTTIKRRGAGGSGSGSPAGASGTGKSEDKSQQ